jgi:hypothetical protein
MRSYKYRHQIDIKRHLLNISIWLDIKKTTLCCINLICFAKVLVCLVEKGMIPHVQKSTNCELVCFKNKTMFFFALT